MNKNKSITKTYVFTEDPKRMIIISCKMHYATISSLMDDYWTMSLGYSICRPGDINNIELGKTIAKGRMEKDIEKEECMSIFSIKPSVNTMKSFAQDYYHYILNNPEEFYIELKRNLRKKVVEAE